VRTGRTTDRAGSRDTIVNSKPGTVTYFVLDGPLPPE